MRFNLTRSTITWPFQKPKSYRLPKQALHKTRRFRHIDSGKQSLVFAQFRQPQDVGFLRANPESDKESPNEFFLDSIPIVLHNEIVKTAAIYEKLTFNHNL